MYRNFMVIVATHWPETDSTMLSCICKETTGDDEHEITDVYHSYAVEILWEKGVDTTIRHRSLKAIESFVQRSRLDSPE
jgi:hypothetical protein